MLHHLLWQEVWQWIEVREQIKVKYEKFEQDFDDNYYDCSFLAACFL